MIPALTLLAGAGLLLGGFLAGLVVGLRTRRGSAPAPVLPICACTHTFGAHTEKGCRAQVRREHYYEIGTRNGWEWVNCACLKYTGPEPITSDIWVPQMAGLPEREKR